MPSSAAAPPVEMSLEQRIEMTASGRDADAIPKVEGAGEVFLDESGERVQRMHNGLKVVADGYCGPWMTRLIERCRGHHEPQEEAAFHALVDRLSERAVMIEVGANWSYYSMWFLKGRPQRRAIVIEPDPNGLALARKNLALNGLSAEFVWGYVGESFAAHVKAAPQPPPQLDLPQIIRERGLAFVDFLHCDAQGAETELLESCAALLRERRVGWLFVSTHGARITGDPLTHQKCLARLREFGAHIEAEHDIHESFSGDGLIVARFDSAAPQAEIPEFTRNRYATSFYRNPLYDVAEAKASGLTSAAVASLVEAAYVALAGAPAPRQEIAKAVESVARGETALADLAQRFLRPPTGGPTETVGLWLELQRDSALGAKGERVLTPKDKVLSPYLIEHGQWHTEPLDLALAHLDPGGDYALVDIGANIGLFSRQFLNAFPGVRRCFCVEPDARNFEALAFNLGKFRDLDLRLFRHALAGASGAARFYRDGDNTGNYSLNPDAMRNRRFDQVEVRAVEAGLWAASNLSGLERIILKTDTQGSDELIATRIPAAIWRNVVFACLEIWRIDKPPFDARAFKEIVESFPNWSFRGARNCPVEEILDYAAGKDWMFYDLYLWR